MKIITSDDIAKLNLKFENTVGWVEYVIRNKNDMLLPAKISLKPFDNHFFNTMPCIIKGDDVFGVKVVSRYPNRVQALDSQILLYDLKTGQPKALMDGNLITALRTGIVAALSVKLFAKSGFENIALIGLGNVVFATVKVLLFLFPQKKITFKLLKYKEQHLEFYETFKNNKNLKFEFYDKEREVIKDSDVVISGITVAENDFADDECYKEGCLVIPIHTKGFGNCDLFFDKVFADDTGHVCGFKYFDKFKTFAEVTDVYCGTATGRVNDKQRILVYNIGIALHDIYFANQIADMINANDSVELNRINKKSWFKELF